MLQATAKRNLPARERINKAWKEQFEVLKALVGEIPDKVDKSRDPQKEVITQILRFNEKSIKLMKSPEHFITFNIQVANFIDVLSEIHVKITTPRTPDILEERSKIIDNTPNSDSKLLSSTTKDSSNKTIDLATSESSMSQGDIPEKYRGGASHLRKGVKRKYKAFESVAFERNILSNLLRDDAFNEEDKVMQALRHLDATRQFTAEIIQTIEELRTSEEKLNYLQDMFLSNKEPKRYTAIDFGILLNELKDTNMNQYWEKARFLIKMLKNPKLNYQEQCSRAFKITLEIDPYGSTGTDITHYSEISDKVTFLQLQRRVNGSKKRNKNTEAIFY